MKILSSQQKRPEVVRTTLPAFWAACGLYVPCMAFLAGAFLSVQVPVIKPGTSREFAFTLTQMQTVVSNVNGSETQVMPESRAELTEDVQRPPAPIEAKMSTPSPQSSKMDLTPKPAAVPEPIQTMKPLKKVAQAKRSAQVQQEVRPATLEPQENRVSNQEVLSREATMSGNNQTKSLKSDPEVLVLGNHADPYLIEVREAVLSNLEYPRRARRMREQGTVMVAFEIEQDGRLKGVTVHQSSGFRSLDEAATVAVRRASSLWRAPERTLRLRMPVEFNLRRPGL